MALLFFFPPMDVCCVSSLPHLPVGCWVRYHQNRVPDPTTRSLKRLRVRRPRPSPVPSEHCRRQSSAGPLGAGQAAGTWGVGGGARGLGGGPAGVVGVSGKAWSVLGTRPLPPSLRSALPLPEDPLQEAAEVWGRLRFLGSAGCGDAAGVYFFFFFLNLGDTWESPCPSARQISGSIRKTP